VRVRDKTIHGVTHTISKILCLNNIDHQINILNLCVTKKEKEGDWMFEDHNPLATICVGLKCKDGATCKNFLLGTPGPASLNFYPQIH